MNPSQRNTDAGASGKEAEAARLMNSGEKHDPPTDSSFQSSIPSAPLLPSSPYNPEMTNLEPPPYSSVVAQDASDLKNQFGSSPTGNLHQAYNQAPYPTGPGSAPQSPYPSKAGYSPYGAPAQAPYPTGPQGAGNPPYPAGPGPNTAITSQPPYSTGSGYTPGPASQAPYPTGPMPMPGPRPDTGAQIGFVAPVTMEPKRIDPHNVPHNVGYGRRTPYDTLGENHRYVHTTQQYATNQYPQQQQQQQRPNVVYVVQKNERTNSTDDDCCLLACCLASCYCLCECIKICANAD